MSILIAYSSKHGCSEKCAVILKEQLHGKVDLINLKEKNDLELNKYNKVILGGSIYVGKIQKEISEFCDKYLDDLKQKKIGLFICGMQDDETVQKQLNENFPKELLEIAEVKSYFGGEFIFNKLNFMEKLIVKKVVKIQSDKSNILEDNIFKFAEEINAI